MGKDTFGVFVVQSANLNHANIQNKKKAVNYDSLFFISQDDFH